MEDNDANHGPRSPDDRGDDEGDGSVGICDFVNLLATWGPRSGSCPADLTGDGAVDFADLVLLLASWS
jgi:hypothetical protein